MRLWVDDLRAKPENFDIAAHDSYYALAILATGLVSHISFDHDLGEVGGTGYDIAKWIEEKAFKGEIKRMSWEIHSANPVGRENIRRAMESADRYWVKVKSHALNANVA